jgi:hypothetical protein
MTKPCKPPGSPALASRPGGKRCACQRLGYVRPACVRGLTGWLDADGQRRFDALACELDSRQFLDPVPAPPAEKGNHRKGKRCVDCGDLISDYARDRCRRHAAMANGAKSRGGPRNEAWARRSRFPVRKIVAKRRAR